MIEVRQTPQFTAWFDSLRDDLAKDRIVVRIRRVSLGLLGDVKFFEGIGELRIDYGPGYRVYFAKRGEALVILLAGGDKKTQSRDIRAAKKIAKGLE